MARQDRLKKCNPEERAPRSVQKTGQQRPGGTASREHFAGTSGRPEQPLCKAGPRPEDTGDFIYGINPVHEALKSGRPLFALYVLNTEHRNVFSLIRLAEQQHIPVRRIGRDFFDMRFDKGHQGIAAHVARKKMLSTDDLPKLLAQAKGHALFLVADCIEDPRNFGAMLRTAEAAGVDGVIFQEQRSAGISPTVAKASAGALEHLSLVETVNIKHALRILKEEGVMIVGAEAGSNKQPWDIDLARPVAIVMGSEGEGMRRTVRELCDAVVALPMRGKVGSLNVSVAAGIMLFEVLRQRAQKS
ncbi:MAG TPA: 23S rRNA (guanosine(2251)-2'-O)-methyltransferase RlmB [Dissulfurispiraceae bacterium]|nr:23S rRNA (guanosine(2251)-2'-O)-methyltransferase RlmB [Dissulfurispiraceae bacterium]